MLGLPATLEDVEVDEIKDYYNCRYLSACKATWRIYGFDIHYRFPPVERLPFHLRGEQSVIFDATDSIDYALEKASVNETKFIAWMERNKTDTKAQELLYYEFPKYYVWKPEERIWVPRQKGTCIGRVHHVPPSFGELFYLRILLNKVKGAQDWIDFKKYDNVVYPTYKDACQARGLLEDDKEYIDGLLEASLWEIVYEKTWQVLAADALHVERIKSNDPDRHCYEAFDRTPRDICRTDISTPSEKVMRLTVNMRLGIGTNISERKEIQDFANWILSIGNCIIGGKNDGETTVEIPEEMLIPNSNDHIGSIIEETYPQLINYLYNLTFFQEKAILAPTHALVDIINDRMLKLLPGDEKTYESSDSVCIADVDTNFNESLYTDDFLNSIRVAGIPQHTLKLKIGSPVMCMRNIDQRAGLCNGTRLQILRMRVNIIEAKIISGGSVGIIYAIPRMVLSPSDTKIPFKFNR
nr:ATP-dependent DNA helicase PIF1-like [Tanacetum cinerariifolium]